MPKVQLFNTQTEQSDIKKRTYVSKEIRMQQEESGKTILTIQRL